MAWQPPELMEPDLDMIGFGAAPDYDLGGMEGAGARGADSDAMRAGRQPQQQRDRDASMGLPMPLPRSTSTSETAQAYSIVPGPIKNFIEFFYRAIITGNVPDILRAYETGFPRLSESFFRSTAWPSEQHVAPLLPSESGTPGAHKLFLVLYKELYYRHVYAKLQVQPVQRLESYLNYCTLFSYVLSADSASGGERVDLELPEQWLWDMLDEFLYQFQSFCHYRCKNLAKKPADELELLIANPKVWNVHSVLNILHSLLERGRTLERLASGQWVSEGELESERLYRSLGYFALVSLLRLHTLLGDYGQALNLLRHVRLDDQGQYPRVPGCHIATFYHAAFCLLMLRRYSDAISALASVLLYVQRHRQFFAHKTTLFEYVNKQSEQMYVLLALCQSLQPQAQKLDDSLQQTLRERYSDRFHRLQRPDSATRDAELDATLSFAAPKFIAPMAPRYDLALALQQPHSHQHIPQGQLDALQNALREPQIQQQRVFLEACRPLAYAGVLRSYLKLYTTLPLAKLASFMEMSPSQLRILLMAIKARHRSRVWNETCLGLGGEWSTQTELDVYIDGDMVHVADTKQSRRYNEYFVRQIGKLDELQRRLRGAEWRVQQHSSAVHQSYYWPATATATRVAQATQPRM